MIESATHSASAVSSVHSPGRKLNGPPPTMSERSGAASRLVPSSVAPSASPTARPTNAPTARSHEWVFSMQIARGNGSASAVLHFGLVPEQPADELPQLDKGDQRPCRG